MRVAIAGAGDLTRYLCEEFTRAGHQLTILTRQPKPQLDYPGVEQVLTDYTTDSLVHALTLVEVLISTINVAADDKLFIHLHQNLIQACQQSPTCKRFIPSEFAGDIEVYPDLPLFYYTTRQSIREHLRTLTDIEWTLVSIGWLADYLVPATNRYMKDVGKGCPINLTDRSIVIPGSGIEPADFTWARDVARALAVLVKTPSWEPYTYISGEHTCWANVTGLVKEMNKGIEFHETSQGFFDIIRTLQTSKDAESLYYADLQLWTAASASSLPQEKVKVHRQKYFPDVRFRTLRDGLTELHHHPSRII